MVRFQPIQALRGELKRTEIRFNTRYQLTTKEFVLQRQHTTYRIALENILGLVECTDEDYRHHTSWDMTSQGVPYKIVTNLLHLVLPSGVVEQNSVSFYTRLSPQFAAQMAAMLTATHRV